MPALKPFDAAAVEAIARVLGHTTDGLSGPDIARFLAACRIPDPGEITKWRRIATALSEEQSRTGSGNCTVAFFKASMQPVRWTNNRQGFDELRSRLNEVLAFSGLSMGDDGQVYRRSAARTHADSLVVKRMRDEMLRRRGHSEVFKYCTSELLAEDCFGAVFEATKGLAQRVREMSGLGTDGHRLVQAAFEGSTPAIAFNSLRTETEENEQRGLANIMKGAFSAFSLLHRRLDSAVVIRSATTNP